MRQSRASTAPGAARTIVSALHLHPLSTVTFIRTRRALLLAACLPASVALAQPARSAAATDLAKSPAAVLMWNEAQKIAGFPHMDSLLLAHVVPHGAFVRALPAGKPLAAFAPGGDRAAMLDDYIASQKVAGLLVLQHGAIRLERYALGYSAAGRWTSFSVAKSVTSTLVGAAIKDGYIKSLDEPITRYITQLAGSAYDGVTVRQLLTMTSGVKWNEDYADPRSDIAQLYTVVPEPGVDANVSYARRLTREAAPGTKWVYKTIETNLIGVLVMDATKRPLADYLAEKIWTPAGMERDAAWGIDQIGHEQGGCCLMVSLHDYARIGQFILEGAKVNGRSIVPDGWFQAATHKQADIGVPGSGYGYQWWTNDDGTFAARGIFGQMIYIDPRRDLVIAMNSAWPVASGRAPSQARSAMLAAIVAAVDAEGSAPR